MTGGSRAALHCWRHQRDGAANGFRGAEEALDSARILCNRYKELLHDRGVIPADPGSSEREGRPIHYVDATVD